MKQHALSLAVLAAVATALPAPASTLPPSRPCTTADLARNDSLVQGRLPLQFRTANADYPVDELPLRSHTAYVVHSLGGGLSVPEESIVLGAPTGVTFAPVSGYPGAHRFDSGTPRTLVFPMSWTQETNEQTESGEFVTCAATAQAAVKVVDPRPLRTHATFTRYGLALTVRPGRAPADTAPFTIEVRLVRGARSAPSLRAAPVHRRTQRRTGFGIESGRLLRGVATFDIATDSVGYVVILRPDNLGPLNRVDRFSFSIAIKQRGKIVGGVRGAARCAKKLEDAGYTKLCRFSRAVQHA